MTYENLGNFQVQIGDLVLAELFCTVTNVEDILSHDVRTNDTLRPTTHGGIFGVDLLAPRKVILDISFDARAQMKAFGEQWYQIILDALAYQFSPARGTIDLAFRLPGLGVARVLHGRPRNYNVDIPVNGVATCKLQFEAADPRLYVPDPQEFLFQESTLATGLTFPLSFPLSFTSNIEDAVGSQVVTNYGTIDAPYVIYVFASSNASIRHEQQDKTLQLEAEFTSGFIKFDSLDRTVVFYPVTEGIDGVNVYHLLAVGSQWFDILPGSQTITFNETGSGGGFMMFRFTDAYL